MKKTLVQRLINGAEIASAAILIPLVMGCQTLPVKKFPKNHIHGVKYQKIDQNKIPYKLENQVIYDVRYYFQEINKTPETLSFEALPFNKVTRELDLDSKKITLDSEEKYIPRKVESKKGKKDKWVDGIILRTDGPYGIKANMTSLEELKKIADVSKNNYGYKIITTEDNASFIIKTIKILGEEYFFPYVEDDKKDEKGKLNHYLIPIKGAKIRVENKCGNLSIYNENDVYRPINPDVFPQLFKETNTESGIQTKTTKSN